MDSRGGWVNAGALLRSLGLSGVDWFNCARPGCCWVHPGWLGSQGYDLGVVGLIWGNWVHSRAAWVPLRSSGFALACATGSLDLCRVIGFTRMRPRCSLVHLGRWVHLCTPWGSLGSSGVVGFTRARPLVHSRVPWWSSGLSGVIAFTRARAGGRCVHTGWLSLVGWVHSRVPWGLMGSTRGVGFVPVRLGYRLVHRRSLGSA